LFDLKNIVKNCFILKIAFFIKGVAQEKHRLL